MTTFFRAGVVLTRFMGWKGTILFMGMSTSMVKESLTRVRTICMAVQGMMFLQGARVLTGSMEVRVKTCSQVRGSLMTVQAR